MVEVLHTFATDHVLRNAQGLPIARAILAQDTAYVRGKPIAVVLLTVPTSVVKKITGYTFYVDGLPYRVPSDISKLRVKEAASRIMVNNFFLQPV